MDSLLANYASSDDDGEIDPHPQTLARNPNPNPNPALFASLPPPSAAALFASLPPPSAAHKPISKPLISNNAKDTVFTPSDEPSNPKGSIFAALPPPKPKNPKKIVQFRPPIDLSVLQKTPFDDDDDNESNKPKIDTVLTKNVSGSSYSSFLPAPKNSFGLGASLGSGSSRISVSDAHVTAEESSILPLEPVSHSGGVSEAIGPEFYSDARGSEFYDRDGSGYYSTGAEAVNYSEYGVGGTEGSGWDPNYGGYVGYEGSSSYESMQETVSEVVPDMVRIGGKRGRNEIPAEIVEVKQDELMKNRPRQDQAKMTGIAFGPSYQAPSSAKVKPSKLHKRKHQIGSLFFDMKQKEMELAERRSRGLLTKAQTQGKYGW